MGDLVEAGDVHGIGQYKRKATRGREAAKRLRDAEREPDDVPWRKGRVGQVRRAKAILGEAEADILVKEYNELKKERAKQDGILLSVLTRNILTDTQIRELFCVGRVRLDKIREKHPALPRVAGSYSEQQTSDLVEFVKTINSEAGFACAHRDQREYLRRRVCRCCV